MQSLKKTYKYVYDSRNTGTFVQNVNTTSVRKVLVLVLEINILALEF